MKKLRFKVQLMAEGEDEAGGEIVELAVLEKDCERIEQLGLSLAESKEILKTLQKHILERQVSEAGCNRPNPAFVSGDAGPSFERC